MGKSGLGKVSVSGRSRVPNPAHNNTPVHDASARFIERCLPSGVQVGAKKSQALPLRASARAVSRHLATTFSLSLGLLLGCGTDAVGVDACLKIERAHCHAAEACGASDGVACERYVEVQCLHGFVKSALPNEKQTNQCANALGQVAECAEKRGHKVSVDVCELEADDPAPARACELVDVPYELKACRFLAPPDTDEEDDEEDQDEPEDDTNDNDDTSAVEDAGSSDDSSTPATDDPDASDANP